MIKIITLLNKKNSLTSDEFSRYWYQKHAPLVLQVWPAIKRYVQNHPVQLPGKKGNPKIDGLAEIYVDDVQSWKEFADFYLSEEGRVIREDEDKFIERSKMVFFIAEEKVIKE